MLNTGYLTAKTDKESDEYYTPIYAIKPILKYIPNNSIIWCPFDKEDSRFVKVFREAGFKVIATHIDNGENFFYFQPEKYDVIISNPPFSIKDSILKRLAELNKPYAIILPIPTLQGEKRFEYIKDCQALIFDKRINYYKDLNDRKSTKQVPFGSMYLCKNFLPKDLIFEELKDRKEI